VTPPATGRHARSLAILISCVDTVAQSNTVVALDSAQHIRFCKTDKTVVYAV